MRVVVLGASGGCGRELVRQLHEAEHDVVAVGRASSDIDAPSGVAVARGSLDDRSFLEEVFAGADAVVSAVGLRLPGIAPWHRPEDPEVLTRCVPVWIEAMRAAGVSRIQLISAGGVGDSFQRMPWFFQQMIRYTPLRYAYADLDRAEALLAESGLRWCAPRPTGLTNGARTGNALVAERIAGMAQISRADVAAWMVGALEADRWEPSTPLITVTGAG